MVDNLLAEASKLIQNENLNPTFIDEVKLFQISHSIPKSPLTYDICFIILLQGRKTIHLPTKTLNYDRDNYLVVPITLPVECETFASTDEPIIALTVEIDTMMMLDIITSLHTHEQRVRKTTAMGIFQGTLTASLEETLYRLLKILQSKEESKILKDSILKELYYRIAVGENAHFLHHMFLEQKHETKIAKSLKTIHDHFDQPIDVKTLAKAQAMSLSSYHRYFKQITSYTPLQYIKKIRLIKAKEFIEVQGLQVNETAHKVGYVSVSQFSRDFKSYFGFPPKEVKTPISS